jgi:hypothetical protein
MNRIIILRLISSERRTTFYGADMPGEIICEVMTWPAAANMPRIILVRSADVIQRSFGTIAK